MDDDPTLDELLAERRSANNRRTPERTPVGASRTSRLMLATVGATVVATLILVVAFVLN